MMRKVVGVACLSERRSKKRDGVGDGGWGGEGGAEGEPIGLAGC